MHPLSGIFESLKMDIVFFEAVVKTVARGSLQVRSRSWRIFDGFDRVRIKIEMPGMRRQRTPK
jgi:hypothetical protein